MNCEIEFLPVGEASKAGDAIVVRYGSDNAYDLMLVDGGHLEIGSDIVAHLRSEYPGRGLQHVLLTHPDIDHACGLRTVLEQIPVANLWMVMPWQFANEAAHLFADKSLTQGQLARKIADQYSILADIATLAEERGIPIWLPLQGSLVGPFVVLSPNRVDYVHLLPQFDRTPEPDTAAIQREGLWIGKASVYARIIAGFEKAVRWISDGWFMESLRDGGKTSATNETSVVLYGAFEGGHRVLLTGDAGVNALESAANYADTLGLPLQQFTFVQIPHHGSRSNVGPAILDRIIGPTQMQGASTRFAAFASVPKDDDQYPRKIVLNAFTRRGGRVSATRGQKIVHFGGFTPRPQYGAITVIPFATQVEDYDS